MTVIGGSKRYNMLPDTFIKKNIKQNTHLKSTPFVILCLNELGCESNYREVDQEGLLRLHCRPTCTRDSLKFNLLGTLMEYNDRCGSGKVFDRGSHKFVIHSIKSWPLKLARNMELPGVRCLTPELIYGEGLP